VAEGSDNDSSVEHELQLVRAGQHEAAELASTQAAYELPADAVPGYEIICEIGRGGMGVVYRALQISTKRIVALKVILAGPFASRATRRRFEREVELAARIRHPGIVRVLEGGLTRSGQQYFAMDHVVGVTLDRYISGSQPDPKATLDMFAQLCDAVECAHTHGVIHRDLKPGNVLIDDEGKPHILDFGLAKATDTADGEDVLTITVSSPGQVLGTLRYLSPEQASHTKQTIDHRTDIYSLGVMLFEAMTGSSPHDTSGHPSEVIRRILDTEPFTPSSLSARVESEPEAIILKALEREPDRRYQSAKEMGEDIRRYLANEPIIARPLTSFYILRKKVSKYKVRLGLAAVLVAIVCTAILLDIRHKQRELRGARAGIVRNQSLVELGLPGDTAHLSSHSLWSRYPELTEGRLSWAYGRFRQARKTGNDAVVADTMTNLKVAFEREPARWPFAALLAQMCRETEDHEQAERFAALAGEEMPDTAEAWYLRSYTTFDLSQALRCVEKTIDKDPAHCLAWRRVAHLRIQTGNFDAALAAAERMVEMGENPCHWTRFAARTLAYQHRYTESIDRFKLALQFGDNQDRIYRSRGVVYLCMKQYDKAIDDYSRSMERYGLSEALWECYFRATPRWITGQLDLAAADYRHVRKLRNHVSFADVRLYLVMQDQASVLEGDGKKQDAEETRRRAKHVLLSARRAVSPGSWLEEIIQCFDGRRTPNDLVEGVDPDKTEMLCEACYYAGEASRLAGRTDDARRWFHECVATELVFDPDSSALDPMNEYHLARWRLDSLSESTQATADIQGKLAGSD